MRIAVTYENGNIFPHFGRTEQFKLYDVADGRITASRVVGTDGQGHGALAGLLRQLGADILSCGGIGGGAQSALAADGSLVFDPEVHCDHHGHDHEHGCGEHHCGQPHPGCGGNA